MEEFPIRISRFVQEHPAIAVAGLLNMMSRYRLVRCARIRAAIVEHLKFVAGCEALPDPVRLAAGQLRDEWENEDPTRAGARPPALPAPLATAVAGGRDARGAEADDDFGGPGSGRTLH